MMKSNKKTNGHSLIELIVAMAVFAVAMTLLSGSFSKNMGSYRTARNIQNSTEAVQQAMNLMVKTFRTSDIATSTVLTNGSKMDVRVFDPSQSKCIRYFFDGSGNSLQYFEALTVTNKADCDSFVWSNPSEYLQSNLIGGASTVVSLGNFYIMRDSAAAPWRVTIRLDVCSAADCAEDEKIKMQTTVSLRQYAEMEYMEVGL